MEIFMNKQAMRFLLTSAMLMVATQGAIAQSPTVPADNSKSSKTDSSNSNATADSQKGNESDRTLTRQIRKSVKADKSLSTYAHNVKIVSINGTVTLNGVVRSNEEKTAIQLKAVTVAGQEHVVNELKIAPPK